MKDFKALETLENEAILYLECQFGKYRQVGVVAYGRMRRHGFVSLAPDNLNTERSEKRYLHYRT